MKKFLSLALALIMTLSLVTISAGATEYKDFTDKDEIQYEEAVAVLNKLGIITGYSEGDFRPEGELTRGAAAKIIVSLLIGPENAEALPTTGNPYPDVPAGNVFAGYIGFCKTSGIISGYGDGTFRPNGTLTGYAFSKMLLGALGYKDQFEGLSGDGWTMNVANLGNKAGLFKRIDFKGGDTVNRETACLLALNTLKATMVEYSGGMNITTDAGSMVVNPTRTYVISNQDYATHISNRKAGNTDSVGNAGSSNTHYTVEFGEEHFRDLRMDKDRNGADDFGRPSNVWSYKKVTIGTYPVEADYTYTTQVIHAVEGTTDASKVRALELSGFTTTKDGLVSQLTINGKSEGTVAKVADIANYTDNGALVEVYISDENADFITDVVVIQTQLMEVKRVGSDYVSLDRSDVDDLVYGYNQEAIDVNVHDVEVDDDYYNVLKELKAGDLVAIVPVTTDGGQTYDVAEAYVPETATGSMTRVETYGTANKGRYAINVTVGGTVYNIAQWNRDLTGIDGDTIRVTNKDVTLYLDKYGNALKADDVGDTSNWMVIKNYTQGLVNGNIVTYANGWDIGGETLSLNIGSGSTARNIENTYLPGDLVYYSNNTNSNIAEWVLSTENEKGVFDVYSGVSSVDATENYTIKSSNTTIRLVNYEKFNGANTTSNRATIDTGIKFIYVNIDSADGEVDSIEFANGVKDTSNNEILGVGSYYLINKNVNDDAHARAQACVSLETDNDIVNADSAVKAVVIKRESTDASASNLLYISNYHGSATLYDNDRRPVYGYEAVIMGTGNKIADEDAIIYSYRNLKIGQFARYTKVTAPEGVDGVNDNFYELRGYGAGDTADADASSTWGRSAAVVATGLYHCMPNDKYLVHTTGNYNNLTRAQDKPRINTVWDTDKEDYYLGEGDLDASDLLNLRGADWVDLRQNVTRIEDIDDLKDYLKENDDKQVLVSLLFNDNPDSDDFRKVYLVVVTGVDDYKPGSGTVTPPSTDSDVTFAKDSGLVSGTGNNQDGTVTGKVTTLGNNKSTLSFDLTAPDWAYTKDATSANVKVLYKVLLDGEVYSNGHVNGLYDIDSSANPTDPDRGYQAIKPNSGSTVFSVTDFKLDDDIPASAVTAAKNAGKPGKVTVEITDVQWRFTKVQYTLSGKAVDAVSGADTYVPSPCQKDNGYSFEIGVVCSAAENVTGTYKIDGLTFGGTAPTNYAVAKVGNATTIANNVWASAKAPVTVDFTIDDSNVKFTVQLGSGSGTANFPTNYLGLYLEEWFDEKPVGFDMDLNTAFIMGTPVTQQVNRNGEATITLKTNSTNKLIVRLVGVDGAETEAKLMDAGGEVSFKISGVTKNITIGQANIEIEPVVNPVPIAATLSGKYSAIQFNMPIVLNVNATEGVTSGGTNYGNAFADFIDKGFVERGWVTGANNNILVIEWKSDVTNGGFIMPKHSISGTISKWDVTCDTQYTADPGHGSAVVVARADNGNVKIGDDELSPIADSSFTMPS